MDMVTPQTKDNAPSQAPAGQDDTHEAALRIARQRVERDRRLREAEHEALETVPEEVHTSIGE